ncbi:MAG: undecaprenyl/decaprenyl-phosphate alpha-N-acetylglucosaminyl 1-phosphate transferase [Planctomycetaceae bacterium]|nr:undecaprenyl/decaprenyl-phosphate alpha-N-acetylglucosaminyl 1-phosphate transferase [Planctomycetaceae bacterium]
MLDIFQWKLISLLGVIAVAGLCVTALVPLLGRLATEMGFVDNPDSRRKLHARPIPLVGGIAIFGTTTLLVVLGVQQFGAWLAPDSTDGLAFSLKHHGLFWASLAILCLGMVDDRYKIRGRIKLAGQLAIATGLIASGYFFDRVQVGPQMIHFGVFAVLVVYFWILGSINSVNLLDGADGFAGTLGFVVSLSLAVMGFLGRETGVEAVIAAALAGSIGGFLWFNMPPAKVYLGDGGSMLIGLVIGALAISTALKEETLYAFVAPIAMLAIPIFDSGLAVLRRQLTGRNIYTVDRGHLHHRLLGHGLSPSMAVLWLFVLCGTTALGGVLSFATRESEFAVVAVVLVVGFLIVGKVFGFAEFSMVGQRARRFALGVLGIRSKSVSGATEEWQLQGTRDWRQLFQLAQKFAEENGLDKLKLDINAPWLHESYHAVWQSPSSHLIDGEDEWGASFPLVLQERVFGRIEVFARSGAADAYRCLPKLMDLLENASLPTIESPPTGGPAKPTVAGEVERTNKTGGPSEETLLVQDSKTIADPTMNYRANRACS